MSTEEPTKSKFTCPTCGNNVTAGPAEVADPVPCPHCGVVGQFELAGPKPGEPASATDVDAPEFSAAPAAESASVPTPHPPAAEPAPVPTPDPAPVPAPHTRKAPPRQKKKAPPPTRRSGGSKDLSQKRSRPGYRRHTPKPVPPSEGSPLMTVFLIVIALALSAIIVLIMLPPNLEFIRGYPAGELGGVQPRNLLAEAQQIYGEMDRAVAFSEEEVNAYLNHRIKGTQKGPLSPIVKFNGIYADFENDQAEFYIERSVFGIPFTMSLKVTKKRLNAKTIWRAGGGSIGRFRLSSQQFKPIIDAFVRLGTACEQEMDAVKKMGMVHFEKDRIVLDRSFNGDSEIVPPSELAPAPATTPEPATEPGAAENPEPAMESGAPGEGMDSAKPDDMDSAKPADMEGAKPDDMDAAKPDDMDAAKPDDMDAAKPDDMDAAKPDDTDAAKPDDMDAAKPENADADKTPPADEG